MTGNKSVGHGLALLLAAGAGLAGEAEAEASHLGRLLTASVIYDVIRDKKMPKGRNSGEFSRR